MCDKLNFLCTFCAAAVTTLRFCRAVAGIHGSFYQGIRGRITMPAKCTRSMSSNRKCKIVGDSPVRRALDSDGFADIKAAIMAYSSYTSTLPVGDERRFNQGTPNEVFRSIERPSLFSYQQANCRGHPRYGARHNHRAEGHCFREGGAAVRDAPSQTQDLGVAEAEQGTAKK
jgi:hypothetical protein